MIIEYHGDSEVAQKLPAGFLSGTVGLICLVEIDNEITLKRIDAALTIIETVPTLSISTDGLENVSSILGIINSVPSVAAGTNTLFEDEVFQTNK